MLCDDCRTVCDHCGDTIADCDAKRHGDRLYCETCYDEHFAGCEHCNQDFSRRDMVSDDSGNMYCRDCYSELYYTCDHCGGEVYRDDVCCPESGACLCESCYDTLYVRCENCGEEISRDNAHHNRNGYFCDGCYDDADAMWKSNRMPACERYDELRSVRTYGVELETANCDGHADLQGRTHFGCKYDGSISGKEFVSPILRGDDGLDEIRSFCRAAGRRDWAVDRKCGYHLHLGVGSESPESLRSIALAYWYTENAWQSFVPASRRGNDYCEPITWDGGDLSRLDTCYAWTNFAEHQNRYRWFNVASYSEHGTFEIRLHTGTLCGEKVVNWVKAHARFVDWAATKTPAEIRAHFSGRTKDEKFAALAEIWDDENLTEYYRDRAKKFGHDYVETPDYSLAGV